MKNQSTDTPKGTSAVDDAGTEPDSAAPDAAAPFQVRFERLESGQYAFVTAANNIVVESIERAMSALSELLTEETPRAVYIELRAAIYDSGLPEHVLSIDNDGSTYVLRSLTGSIPVSSKQQAYAELDRMRDDGLVNVIEYHHVGHAIRRARLPERIPDPLKFRMCSCGQDAFLIGDNNEEVRIDSKMSGRNTIQASHNFWQRQSVDLDTTEASEALEASALPEMNAREAKENAPAQFKRTTDFTAPHGYLMACGEMPIMVAFSKQAAFRALCYVVSLGMIENDARTRIEGEIAAMTDLPDAKTPEDQLCADLAKTATEGGKIAFPILGERKQEHESADGINNLLESILGGDFESSGPGLLDSLRKRFGGYVR